MTYYPIKCRIYFHQYSIICDLSKISNILQMLSSKRRKKKKKEYYSLLNIQLKDFFSLCPAEYPGTHIAFIRVRNSQSRFLFLIHCEFMESCLKWITQSYVNIIKFERKMPGKKILLCSQKQL